jgi:hypothetical protein
MAVVVATPTAAEGVSKMHRVVNHKKTRGIPAGAV